MGSAVPHAAATMDLSDLPQLPPLQPDRGLLPPPGTLRHSCSLQLTPVLECPDSFAWSLLLHVEVEHARTVLEPVEGGKQGVMPMEERTGILGQPQGTCCSCGTRIQRSYGNSGTHFFRTGTVILPSSWTDLQGLCLGEDMV